MGVSLTAIERVVKVSERVDNAALLRDLSWNIYASPTIW